MLGAVLAVRSDGSDSDASGAATLLPCNSLGVDLTMWDPQVEVWARERRVIRFDRRGHGRSTTPPPPYTLGRLGCDAVAVLDALQIDVADVCGLPLGGLVAQWLAANAPDRVRRVLADTAPRIGTAKGWLARIDAVRADGMTPFVNLLLRRPAFPVG